MEDLVLLHGFAGTGRTWDATRAALPPSRYRCHAPDLRGHGDRARARPITWAASVADVLALVPGAMTLVGYSLGGRIAQHVALAAPDRVARLVLVATQPGIEDTRERMRRAAADDALAQRTEAHDVGAFASEWMSLPLFAGTPPAARATWEQEIRRNTPGGLAESLRGLTTGRMTPLWDRLGELGMPVDVVAGQRDAKYTQIAREMTATLPNARLHVLADAGHGLPREAPAALAALLAERCVEFLPHG